MNTVHIDKKNKKQQKQVVEQGVRRADSHIVMIEHESEAACKAVSYIYGTIMSRLPKSYKWVHAIQGDKPLPAAGYIMLHRRDTETLWQASLCWAIASVRVPVENLASMQKPRIENDCGNSLLAF